MSSLHPTTPLPRERLAALAAVVEHRVALEGSPASMLLRARDLGDEVELGWLPLARGRHPVDELLCSDAPDDCCAVGVAAPGRATHLDEPDRPPLPVRTVHLVGRDGSWASRWGPSGEAASGTADDPGRPVGRIDDVCRRALGLSTGAPPVPTSVLWAVQWLDAIVDVAVRTSCAPAVVTWDAVALRHPALHALQADIRDGAPTPEALARDAHQLGVWRDWPVLRRACAAGTWDGTDIEPAVAAWLDDGAFARWVLGAYPELDDLRAAAGAVLPGRVARALEATLAAAGGSRP